MTKDLLIIGAVVALVAIMILAALPEITSAMPRNRCCSQLQASDTL